MDWNAIYEAVSPYLGTTTIAAGIIAVLTLICKFVSFMKQAKAALSSTESEAIKAFKKAIPESLYLQVETLTKKELTAIVEEIKTLVDEKFLAQIKANTELTQAVAKALMSLKAMPDSTKEEIGKLLDIKPKDTKEAMKVELLPVEEETKEKTAAYPLM